MLVVCIFDDRIKLASDELLLGLGVGLGLGSDLMFM